MLIFFLLGNTCFPDSNFLHFCYFCIRFWGPWMFLEDLICLFYTLWIMGRVALSTYTTNFISLLYLVRIPLISFSFLIIFCCGSNAVTNSSIDKGIPCLTVFSIKILCVSFSIHWYLAGYYGADCYNPGQHFFSYANILTVC